MANPYHRLDDEGKEYPFLSASELDDSQRKLRRYLREHRQELWAQPEESLGQATERVFNLVENGLIKTQAARWSSLVEFSYKRRGINYFFVKRWPHRATLHSDITSMLKNRVGRAGKSGRPAYLACATLAALLKVDTMKVVDLLANYRRKLGLTNRKSSRTEGA